MSNGITCEEEPSQYHELGEDFVDLLQPYLLGDDGKKKTIHRVCSSYTSHRDKFALLLSMKSRKLGSSLAISSQGERLELGLKQLSASWFSIKM
ncbi:hypothetical protein Tco_1027566 [Tanacetum coccineum]